MSFDGNDLLFGNAAPSAAFDPETVVRGRVTEFGKNHRREFDGKTRKQGDPLYWQADGSQDTKETDNPVLDPVLTLQTPFRSGEAMSKEVQGDDDGRRRVFLSGRSKKSAYHKQSTLEAVRSAIIAAGVRKVSPGDFIEIECTGTGKPSARGINGAKLFSATYYPAAKPPAWAEDCDAGLAVVEVEDDEDVFA